MIELFLYFFLIIIVLVNYKFRKIISYKINLIDRPDNIRKFHSSDVPLIGSFPLVLSLILSLIILKNDFSSYLIVPLVFFVFGLLDDIQNISYNKKFIIWLATLIIFYFFYPENLIKTVYFESIQYKKILIFEHGLVLTIFCIIVFINAFNFSDGINSLSSYIAIIWLMVINFVLLDEPRNYLSILIFCLLINSIVIYNGKYFLGDSGTLFLSSLIGLETIRIYNTSIISYESIFILFMIPGIDMIRLFVTRLSKKKNPFLPDRNHLHHLLIKKYKLFYVLIIYLILVSIPIFLDLVLEINVIYIISVTLTLYFLLIYNLKKFS